MNMDNSVRESLPSKLKLLRIESGKSQVELAKQLGITRSCLANYESGKRQPDNEMLVKIADSFQVLTDYLVSRTDIRQLDLDAHEIKDSVRLKYLAQNMGDALDITEITMENRFRLFEYYDYITSKNQTEKIGNQSPLSR